MRGFDKLEEGRSRVLVYQVGSIQIIYQDVIRWLYQVDCQMDPYQILVDSFISQWMLVESIGSSWIQLDLRWIHVYLRWIHVYLSGSQLDPCVSSWILVYLSRAFIDLSISITRSLQILVDLQYIHLYLYIPTLSLSIHSYPLLSTLSIYSISFNIHSMQQIYFAFFIKALLNMRIFRIFPLFTSRKLLQPIKSIQNTSIPLIDIIPINWNSFQSSCTCHHVHPSFFSKSLLINVDDSIQYNNQLLFFLFIV